MVFLLWCATVREIGAQPFYRVAPLPFNTSYANEMAAVPYDNGLIYCSDQKANVLISKTDLEDRPLFYLYFVPKKDSLKWGGSRLLYKELVANAHQGPCSVSADGNDLYYTAFGENGNGIYSARKEGAKWANIRPFTYNRTNYGNIHPSLSRDGKRLFFASDMPGGYGGYDIYCCEWTPRGWGTPKNLGPEVNTDRDEQYPFIQANGVLYFSTTGHESMGGLDIFSVREKADGTWGMRIHLDSPINSASDDFAYAAADADGQIGYFSSGRNGKTVDIFSFESLFPVFSMCLPQEENDYTYEFFEPGTVDLDTTTFRYEWDLGDGTIKKGQVAEHTFASTGHYLVQLNVVDTLTGERFKQVASYPFDVLDIEQPYITTKHTVAAGASLSFDASKTYLPEMDIQEYYWIFGDGMRTKGEFTEHIFTLPGVYQVQLGVIGKSKETGEEVKACSFLEITVTQ